MGLQWGSLRPESPEHSGTAPTPGLGSACSHLAVDRRRPRKVGREAYLSPGAPVANLLLSGQPARTRLRGLPRALGPHLRPARGAPTRNRTFAPRRKWLRVGWVPRVRMRPCAPHRRRCWAVELERLQIADSSTCVGRPLPRQRAAPLQTAIGLPAIATFPSVVGGAPWLTRSRGGDT